ncbi:hypothetical protein [Faecalicatena contorta]|uniref:hypothetical protein n=1 Tax=Faecalicatena contorta TaxID=39482 RepID=UPI001F3F1891|nr:hypothetical protein [Faecalicatena contorta]MCF2554399.1 hypothetical protein [Faecalicatena contorta]
MNIYNLLGKDKNVEVLIYGQDFDDKPIKLSDILYTNKEIAIMGKVESFDTLAIRNNVTILIITLTDFDTTFSVKMFLKNYVSPNIIEIIKGYPILKVKGATVIDKSDDTLKMGCISGIKLITKL